MLGLKTEEDRTAADTMRMVAGFSRIPLFLLASGFLWLLAGLVAIAQIESVRPGVQSSDKVSWLPYAVSDVRWSSLDNRIYFEGHLSRQAASSSFGHLERQDLSPDSSVTVGRIYLGKLGQEDLSPDLINEWNEEWQQRFYHKVTVGFRWILPGNSQLVYDLETSRLFGNVEKGHRGSLRK